MSVSSDSAKWLTNLLRNHIEEKRKRGLIFDRCYICGEYHPVDVYLPLSVVPISPYKLGRQVERLHEAMRKYHKDREFGENISNWLTKEFRYDGPYWTAVSEDARHTE